MVATTTMGRSKIEMKKIHDEDARMVCFCKRRTGLFKKACELSALCGAETTIVVYSPAGRAYSLGNPDVNKIIDRFLSPDSTPDASAGPTDSRHMVAAQELNRELSELRSRLEFEKSRHSALKDTAAEAAGARADVNYSQLHELEPLEDALRGLMREVALWVDKLLLRAALSSDAAAGSTDKATSTWSEFLVRGNSGLMLGRVRSLERGRLDRLF